MNKLNLSEVTESVKTISPEWTIIEDHIKRDFQFKNFVEAFDFMTKVATKAEELNHHPEWSNVYNKVSVSLSTHDVKGLSELDFKLAQYLDQIS